ncbi:MAG: phosphotransferase family protein [Acidimicrobiales bacterium]
MSQTPVEVPALLTDQDSRDPLNWLSQILWPDRSTRIKPGGSASPQWWASPSAESPKILVPAQSIAAARTSVKRYHDGFSTKLRVRSMLAEAIMGVEPLARLLLRGKQVGVDGGLRRAPGIDGDVLEGIRQLLDVDRLHVAVSLSTPKSNQKPVLQLLDDDGRCLGWAKVAWNERTEALVGNEASWLERKAEAPLSKPDLMHDLVIAGRRVAISSGVEAGRRPQRGAAALPDLDVFKAVSNLGDVETIEIERSAWWRSVEAVLGEATDQERQVITAAVESCAGLKIQVGAWHGDLTPWNLMTTKDRVHLIDWEFAADGVPFGFDLCHFHTQVASEMKGCEDPASNAALALDYSARLSPHGLASLGVEPANRTAVWRLYLVELMRRYLALRVNNYPTDQVTQGPAALARLEATMGTDRQQAVLAPVTEIAAAESPTDSNVNAGHQARGGFFESDEEDHPAEPIAAVGSTGKGLTKVGDGPANFAELLADGGAGYSIKDHEPVGAVGGETTDDLDDDSTPGDRDPSSKSSANTSRSQRNGATAR